MCIIRLFNAQHDEQQGTGSFEQESSRTSYCYDLNCFRPDVGDPEFKLSGSPRSEWKPIILLTSSIPFPSRFNILETKLLLDKIAFQAFLIAPFSPIVVISSFRPKLSISSLILLLASFLRSKGSSFDLSTKSFLFFIISVAFDVSSSFVLILGFGLPNSLPLRVFKIADRDHGVGGFLAFFRYTWEGRGWSYTFSVVFALVALVSAPSVPWTQSLTAHCIETPRKTCCHVH